MRIVERLAVAGELLTLVDHPVHTGADESRDRFVIMGARHTARCNLAADVKAQVQSLLGAIALDQAAASLTIALGNDSDEPVYACRLQLQRAAVPVRMAALDEADVADVRLSPRPTIDGVQTALVVGTGEPVHTDRDHRIKIQFHWQRGDQASHRLAHPAGSNAPANDASGTWMHVAESVAGANWGQNFTPRVGQEVLVGFVGGDIDRPVVLGVPCEGGSP